MRKQEIWSSLTFKNIVAILNCKELWLQGLKVSWEGSVKFLQ